MIDQETLVQLHNEAMRLAEQDPSNDFGTILEGLVEDYEEGNN